LIQLENIIDKYHHLEESVKVEFLSCFSEKEIKKGENFVSNGQYTSQIGFIKSGVFRVFYTDFNGNDINNAFLLENDFIIGRLKPFSKVSTSIQALKDSKLLTADLSSIYKLTEKHHSISQLFLKLASSYFDRNVDRELKLRKYDAINNYLFFLEDYPNLINQIPHYYVADYIQISSTHLSRIRKKLMDK